MFSLGALARSTLGELKGALVDEEEEEDSEEEEGDDEARPQGAREGDAAGKAAVPPPAPAAAAAAAAPSLVAGAAATMPPSLMAAPVPLAPEPSAPPRLPPSPPPASSFSPAPSPPPPVAAPLAPAAGASAALAQERLPSPPPVAGASEPAAAIPGASAGRVGAGGLSIPLPPTPPPQLNGGSGGGHANSATGPVAAIDTAMPAHSTLGGASSKVAETAAAVAREGKRENRDALAGALQGATSTSPGQLLEESEEARRRFAALLETPGLAAFLHRASGSGGSGSDAAADVGEDAGKGDGSAGTAPPSSSGGVVSAWNAKEAAEASVPRIAADCADALRKLAPRLLIEDADVEPSDKQRLLASFSERYDALFEQHEATQRRCQELSAKQEEAERLAQEVLAWQAAYSSATAKVEAVTLENADLKDRVGRLETGGMDPEERSKWQQMVAQREAELNAAGQALRQLQEVMEDGAGADSARASQLEAQLRKAGREVTEANAAREASLEELRMAQEAAQAASTREEEHLERCRRVEEELRETGAALEALLKEKSRHLDEREHLVDRRLVTSTLSQCLEHLASGQRTLAEQVLSQTLQVLGGVPEEAAALRQRIKDLEQRRQVAEPLGDAFLDFLTREASDGDLDERRPGGEAAAAPSAAKPRGGDGSAAVG